MAEGIEISGLECVSALLLDGFRVRRRGAGATTLERGTQIIIVPDALVLSAAMLDAILASADLSHERFLALLAEEPTQPDRAVLAASLES